MKLNKTKLLIFITLFCLPGYLVRFSLFGVPTNLLELMIYATFLSWLWKSKLNISFLDKNLRPYFIGIVLILIGLTISTFINQNYHVGFGVIKGWFLDPLFLFIVIIQEIKSRRDVENVLKTLYITMSAVSVVALGYLLSGTVTYDGRLQAFYNSPNYLAMFLAPAVFIGIYLMKSKVSYIFSLAAILLVLYFTYSYAAWISILASLILVSVLQQKNYPRKIKTIIFVTGIVFLAFITQTNNPKFQNFYQLSSRSSLESRIMIWKSAAKITGDNILFGIGPGNFQNKYLEYQKYFPPYLEWAVPQPHNLYLAFWLQSGILGLAGFLLLIYVWLRELIKIIAQKNSSRFLAAILVGIIFSILIHGLFDTPYWKNDLAVMFWIVFVLGIIINQSGIFFHPADSQRKGHLPFPKETD